MTDRHASERVIDIVGIRSTALGGVVGGPLGAAIGGGLASAAGGALGLEAETLSAEDQEFEGAKQFVRMSGQAISSALAAPPSLGPTSAAQQAVTAAASRLAPGLLGRAPASTPAGSRGHSGRWVRKGRNIVLLNICVARTLFHTIKRPIGIHPCTT
jgi:hypothetical protein